jgi:hypothetical protein
VVLIPWAVRNHSVSGEWIAVNWNGVRNLYHANRIGSDRYLTYRAIYDKTGVYATADSRRIDAIESDMKRMRAMRTAFLAYVRDHPIDYLTRCVNRVRIIFSWDLMPLSRLWRAKILPVPSGIAFALGVLHAIMTLALACCAAAFFFTMPRLMGISMAVIVAALTLPYVLVSATPNYAVALHVMYVIVAGRVLGRPGGTWRRLTQTRRRWAIATIVCSAFALVSVEWTIRVLRAGPS